jgi:choline dehydrogenase-like flavoprotein
LSVIREKLRAVQAGRGFALSAADLGHLGRGVHDVMSLARGFLIDHRRHFPRDAAVHLRVDCEQQPDGASRLLPTGEHDALGLPRLALDWQVSPLERHSVRRTAQLLGAELERAGVGALDDDDDPFAENREWGALRGDSFHMMGGTRMARDAASGVVDTDARVFGTENVYVAGASVFPTGGMANPTLTLLALALRLADHLVRTL